MTAGPDHLRGLRVHPVAARGQPRLAGPGNHQPQHDRAQSGKTEEGLISAAPPQIASYDSTELG